MKKALLTAACLLAMACSGVTAYAASLYSAVRYGYVSLYQDSADGAYRVDTKLYNVSDKQWGNFLFRIPVSDIKDGQCLVVDSSNVGAFKAGFFWSSENLNDNRYWTTSYVNGTAYKSNFFGDGAPYLQPLKGTLTQDSDCLLMDYQKGVNVFWIPSDFNKTSGYYYISGYTDGYVDAGMLKVTVGSEDDFPAPTPTPTPTPTPVVPDVGDIGSVSKELGTFGTDDGTQNWVWESFKRLHDSLYDIAMDASTPDMSVLEDDNQLSKSSPAAYMEACPAAYMADAKYVQRSGEVFGRDEKVLLDKWQAEQYETVEIGASWNISPESVEIAQTSAIKGEGFRDGNAYVLHYKLHLPFRFMYSGHVGTAYSNPTVTFNLRIDYAGLPDYGRGTVQYGTPTVYVDNEGVSYDRYDALEVNKSTISGDAGIAFLNIPVLDNLSQYSYDVVVDFPLYITDVNDPLVFANAFAYESMVTLNSLTYAQDLYFQHLSNSTTDQTLQDIADEQKKQNELENERYEEEQKKTEEAVDSVNTGVSEITDIMSKWEILMLPVTVMKDLIDALTSDGSASLTFPSFSLNGMALWPSYTFDLNVIAEKFPLLHSSLRVLTGIIVVILFLRYLWDIRYIFTENNKE